MNSDLRKVFRGRPGFAAGSGRRPLIAVLAVLSAMAVPGMAALSGNGQAHTGRRRRRPRPTGILASMARSKSHSQESAAARMSGRASRSVPTHARSSCVVKCQSRTSVVRAPHSR